MGRLNRNPILTAEIGASHGSVLELWAVGIGESADTPLVFKAGDRVALRLEAPPSTPHFYRYRNIGDADLTVLWDPTSLRVPYAYLYDPATVGDEGVAFVDFAEGGIRLLPPRQANAAVADESARPQLRFSPFKGWMNDPNGLCLVDGVYHLFYQFHPPSADWGPMHWGHATSRDLVRWTHQPVFLHPEQDLWSLRASGGAFSGSAVRGETGDLSFFHTERLAADDPFTGYREIQKRVFPAEGFIGPREARVVLDRAPPTTSHDFRDPKVWKHGDDGTYRMILGAETDGDPSVLLYASPDGDDWHHEGVLYRAPAHFAAHGARSIECPDLFELDGRWVLIMSFVGYHEPETGRHNLMYALVGDFDGAAFVPSGELQELDFGTDFYAMQSFEPDGRRLALAWLFNWETGKPPGSAYSGELSLPRVLTLEPDGTLAMKPDPAIDGLRQRRLSAADLSDLGVLGADPIELNVAGTASRITIVATSTTGSEVRVGHDGTRFDITASEHDGTIRYVSRDCAFRSARIFFDRGVVEIFGNGGTVCGTTRAYRMDRLTSISVDSDDSTVEVEAYACSSAWTSG